MTTLREVIKRFQAQPKLQACRPPEKLAEVHADLKQWLAQISMREPDTQRKERAYLALKEVADNQGRGIESLSIANLKNGAWVLFEPGQNGAEPLATNKDLVLAYFKEVITRDRVSVTSALISAFLMVYPAQFTFFHGVRRTIASHVLPRANSPRIERWRNCIEHCDLLDERAPQRLANRLAAADIGPSGVLERCCLYGLLANSELVKQAYKVWIGQVSDDLRAERQVNAWLVRFLVFARSPHDQTKLRYESLRSSLANGLLLPFAEAGPRPDTTAQVKNFLLDTLGDPRLTGAKRWHGVDERARAVMLRWLVKSTLEDFFRLLEYAAKHDETAARHWKDRKIFWSRYLDKGHIHDAWVALGPTTEIEARRFLSTESRVYAELRGSGVLPNHSAIIMRIGSLTITEWSHSGKFRAWYPNNRYQPKPHKTRYERPQLVNDSYKEIIHHGRWQQRISDLIYQQTGIAL